jgi:hypothetical protein
MASDTRSSHPQSSLSHTPPSPSHSFFIRHPTTPLHSLLTTLLLSSLLLYPSLLLLSLSRPLSTPPMSSSRFLLALVVLLSLALTIFAQGDPATYCAPVQIDAFAVTATGAGDTEGAQLVVVNGTYPIQQYFVALTDPYANPNIFFRVVLTSNTSTATAGTVGVQFTISLNGVYRLTSAGIPQVYTPGTTGSTDVEFFNWQSSQSLRINNTRSSFKHPVSHPALVAS